MTTYILGSFPLLEYYHIHLKSHFYTTDINEIGKVNPIMTGLGGW
jgi:hypothetical protein